MILDHTGKKISGQKEEKTGEMCVRVVPMDIFVSVHLPNHSDKLFLSDLCGQLFECKVDSNILRRFTLHPHIRR